MDGARKIWNVSRDVIALLLGTVCCPSAGTSYCQPVHHIWSLYVDSLRRYEGEEKCKNLGGFGVRCHPKSSQTSPFNRAHMSSYLTLIDIMHASILYCFWVIASFLLKVANFYPPYLHLSPRRGWSCSNFAVNFGVRQLKSRAIVWHYLCDPTFSRFDTIAECDRHSHRHTHGQTDIFVCATMDLEKIFHGTRWTAMNNVVNNGLYTAYRTYGARGQAKA